MNKSSQLRHGNVCRFIILLTFCFFGFLFFFNFCFFQSNMLLENNITLIVHFCLFFFHGVCKIKVPYAVGSTNLHSCIMIVFLSFHRHLTFVFLFNFPLFSSKTRYPKNNIGCFKSVFFVM